MFYSLRRAGLVILTIKPKPRRNGEIIKILIAVIMLIRDHRSQKSLSIT